MMTLKIEYINEDIHVWVFVKLSINGYVTLHCNSNEKSFIHMCIIIRLSVYYHIALWCNKIKVGKVFSLLKQELILNADAVRLLVFLV